MDNTRWDLKVFLDFSKHIWKGDEDGNRNPSRNYDARLIYNNKAPNIIKLHIFYENKYHVLERFEHLKENGVNILSVIKKVDPFTPWENPDELDLSQSHLIDFRKNSAGWEHNKRVVEIIIDNVDIFVLGKYNHHGLFLLTENATQPICEYIKYSKSISSDDWDYKLVNSDKNRTIQFGRFNFLLKLQHNYENSDKLCLRISRIALLQVEALDEDIDNSAIIRFGELICILMSFFWNKRIDFFQGHARVINTPNIHTQKFFRFSNWPVDNEKEFNLKSRYTSFYDFIESLDYTKTHAYSSLLNVIVPRIIQSKHVDEISEFMLLYNVIEEIRNFCMDNPINGKKLEIKEEYDFICSNTATKGTICNKIKEIAEIVEEKDKSDFISNAHKKVSSIMKTGLIDQFDSLIRFFGLNPEIYQLDFTNLIKIRNKIYHGKQIMEDVKPYNQNMKLLIDDLILRLIQ